MTKTNLIRLSDYERDKQQRALYDEDDRVRCSCTHQDLRGEAGTRSQCLALTRHPSGKCVDCRLRDDE